MRGFVLFSSSHLSQQGGQTCKSDVLAFFRLKTIILICELTFLSAVVVGPTLLLCHYCDNQTNILQSNCKGFPL